MKRLPNTFKRALWSLLLPMGKFQQGHWQGFCSLGLCSLWLSSELSTACPSSPLRPLFCSRLYFPENVPGFPSLVSPLVADGNSLKNIENMLHWKERSNKYVNRKEGKLSPERRLLGGMDWKLSKGRGRNIGTAVQGRGLKCKNIGLKKARRKLHERAEKGERLGYKERQERYRHENKKTNRISEIKRTVSIVEQFILMSYWKAMLWSHGLDTGWASPPRTGNAGNNGLS